MELKFKKVTTIREFIDAIRIRVDVFILEQKFQPGWEPDEDDKNSTHYIVLVKNEIVGTARVRKLLKGEVKIERMAIKKEYRGKGIGRDLIGFIVDDIKKLQSKRIYLQSQVQAQEFYEKCGFKVVSEPYDAWGVPHIDMDYTL